MTTISGSTFTVIGARPAAAAASGEAPVHRHRGTDYRTVLGWLHTHLAPQRYLEIGSASGGSLALARCSSIAIDPAFRLGIDPLGTKPALHLFQAESDRFFAEQDPTRLLGGPVDFAFLDGMHLFEFLLRDFANVERFCRPDSVIALHDCLPIDTFMADRERRIPDRPLGRPPAWWTGDVWKFLDILKEVRPDVRMLCLDAEPTGLVLCTGLNPTSTTLLEQHDEILREWMYRPLDEHGLAAFLTRCEIASTETIATRELIHQWLRREAP